MPFLVFNEYSPVHPKIPVTTTDFRYVKTSIAMPTFITTDGIIRTIFYAFRGKVNNPHNATVFTIRSYIRGEERDQTAITTFSTSYSINKYTPFFSIVFAIEFFFHRG